MAKGKEYIGVIARIEEDGRVINTTAPFEATGKVKAMVLLRDHAEMLCEQEKVSEAKLRLWLIPLAEPHGKMKFNYTEQPKLDIVQTQSV